MKSMSYVEGRLGTWRNFPNLRISCPSIAQWAPIPLRLIVGYGFMEHGFVKAARGFDLSGYLRGWLARAPKAEAGVRLEVDVDPMSFL